MIYSALSSISGGVGDLVSISGNTGTATPDGFGNISLVTANSSVKFVASGSTITQDFGLSNLVLGSSLPAVLGASNNVGIGNNIFSSLTTGDNNVFVGNDASGSPSLTTGGQNCAIGTNSLVSLISGSRNTAIGYISCNNISTGSDNISIGQSAGRILSGSDSSNINIGHDGISGDSHIIRIGTQGSAAGRHTDFYAAGVLHTTSGRTVNVTTPGAYPYTTLTTDYLILVDTSSARTITPLASPATGTTYRIKDNVGSAAANNITVTPSGKNIDGAASFVINTNWGSVDITYNGTQWNVL